jgi:hypothetical protein
MPALEHPPAPVAPSPGNARRTLTHAVLIRVLITAGFLAIWFWTQSLIGARPLSAAGIEDRLHSLTAALNAYLFQNPRAAGALLILSSFFIDLFGVFLLAGWIFGRSVRPFLGLVLLMLLRQLVQGLVVLPPPPHMIWRDPGFPSLLVTYSVAGDFFFSAHTAIAVFGAIELARLKRPFITAFAVLIAAFEIAAVIILRAHYTMDVVTGLLAALCVAQFAEHIAPPIDRLLARF